MILADPETHASWLEARKNGIGGSDAACVLGRNKYKSNLQLWREKTGADPKDISDKPAVVYGKKAESYLRELFALDFPEYDVEYHEYRMYAHEKYPFIFATLDGELTAKSGENGVLEIKTTTINNADQWNDWDEKIPDNYYVQVLHQLLATGFDFAILKAHIRYFKNEELNITTRHYRIDRAEVKDELSILLDAEIRFWKSVQNKAEPPLILPEI
ncbi:MAG: YqaJ viral recombinase family protein [Clostridium sp.]|nr:YqaJ viral recombinase family protein [Clostridium sp.]MCM1547939.1 YqaJ viral recombinase family protein [Ruminococcus sp.]